jgi:hypothetical protein
MKVLVVLLLFYLVWAYIRYDPKLDWIEKEGETHVFSLNGNNWVTKSLLAIKEILNKKI